MRAESIAVRWGEEGTCGTHGTGRTYVGSASLLAAVVVLLVAGGGFCAQAVGEGPFPEATVFRGIDGRLLHTDANDAWWFELTAAIEDDGRPAPAGMRFRLLPCALLERLIADVNDRYLPLYRLSARVTRYEGTNYFFPTYFLPLSKFKSEDGSRDAEPAVQDQSPRVESGLQPSDPELAIPPEIVEKLKNRRPLRGPLRKPSDNQKVERPDRHPDRMIANQVGLIETGDRTPPVGGAYSLQPAAWGRFIPYPLGWNVSDVRYELLPCNVLERVRQIQQGSIEPVRFNVAGLLTEFQGRQYLLLQRAVPVHNYGNFGR